MRCGCGDLHRAELRNDPITPFADAVQILDRTVLCLQELDGLVVSCLRGAGASGAFRARMLWIKTRSKAERLQQKLRDAKQDLMVLMESQSV
jgi:hypothetical protein